MVKKPANRRAPQAAQPTAAQLKSIDRLLETGRYEQAIERLPKLIERFPEHGGLRLALIEALEATNDGRTAAAFVLDWASARPRSLRAQETLLIYAARFGYLALTERTARLVRELGGEVPAFIPSPEAIVETFPPLPDGRRAGLADIVRFDIGSLYLHAQRFEDAIHWFEDLEIQAARNNHALVLYHQECIDEALEAFIANWQRDPDNLFALASAARLRLYRGDEVGALGLCTPLAAATARRDEEALNQIMTLLLLGQDEAAWNAFERVRRTDWFDESRTHGQAAQILHFGACAAARLKRLDEARRLWREAGAANQELTKENLDRLDQEPDGYAFPMLFDIYLALPVVYVNRLRAQARTYGAGDRIVETHASNRYLDALYRTGNAYVRNLAKLLLQDRVEQGDKEAADAIKALVRLPIGTIDDRINLLTLLRQCNQLAADEPVMVWEQGECREIKLVSTEIYREAAPTNLPSELDDDYIESIGRHRRGDYAGAERLTRAMLERAPDHPMLLSNLAATCLLQGRREEGRTLLKRAIEKNPDYLFARCNLANLHISAGELEEAERLLTGLPSRPRLHIQEVFAIYGGLARLKHAQGDTESAQKFIRSLEALVEDEDDERRLIQIKQAIEPKLIDKEMERAMAKLLAQMQKPKPRAKSTSKPRKRT